MSDDTMPDIPMIEDEPQVTLEIEEKEPETSELDAIIEEVEGEEENTETIPEVPEPAEEVLFDLPSEKPKKKRNNYLRNNLQIWQKQERKQQ